jgi:hypothetical protein
MVVILFILANTIRYSSTIGKKTSCKLRKKAASTMLFNLKTQNKTIANFS